MQTNSSNPPVHLNDEKRGHLPKKKKKMDRPVNIYLSNAGGFKPG